MIRGKGMAASRTLVCGGGGVWGIAWMSGLACGLAQAGLDLRTADAFVGTSAGSVVSAQLARGMEPKLLFERQSDPARQPRELIPPPDGLAALFKLIEQPWPDDDARLRAVCELGRESETVSLAERRASIVDRLGLPDESWPAKALLLAAVDDASFELKAFGKADKVSLIDAVAASCSIPAAWPAVPIGDRRYVDGGLWRTSDNAHLAAGSDHVLVVSPMGLTVPSPGVIEDIKQLEHQGASVALIAPDEEAAATMAMGPLDPACRKPAAEAGRAQGRREMAEKPELRGLFA
jgi:NTE family protein